MLKILDWNISYTNNAQSKIEYLDAVAGDDSFIAILQEVTPSQFAAFKEHYGSIEYSLNYREPGKFDTKQRQLGVAIITSDDIKLTNAKVLDRCLLPDRTLMADAVVKGQTYRVMGLHSITGVSHKKAKSMQFLSFAEEVDWYKPDIVAFDANEPKLDHFNVENMVFFDNQDRGHGAYTFFHELNDVGLKDSILAGYDESHYIAGEPLAISHRIEAGDQKKRYDFVFVKDSLDVINTQYNFHDAVSAGSDHALIRVDLNLSDNQEERSMEARKTDPFEPVRKFQEEHPTKASREEALRNMTNAQIDELIKASGIVQAKIYYASFKKKEE